MVHCVKIINNMYLLPNKKHIDIDSAVVAVLDGDKLKIYFLDTEKGSVVCFVVEGKNDDLENIRKQSDRYFEIPRASNIEKEKWMRSFVEEMIPFEDPAFSEKLLAVRNESFYENALEEIEKSKDGWNYGWAEWSRNYAYEIIDEWFSTLPVEITNEWEGCDDCAICRAMAECKDSAPELLKAFSEQNFMNEVEKVIKKDDK